MKIKDLPAFDRPREKLIRYGVDKLTTAELLAILLRTGTKGVNVLDLASKVLRSINSQDIKNLDLSHLEKISGLGQVKACEVVACLEIGRRLLQDKKSSLYLSPEDIFKELKDIRISKKEHFIIFYLDTRNQEIRREVIAVGSLNTNFIHPREVFEPAVQHLASQIIIVHNHPSGNPAPSKEDTQVTEKLIRAGDVLGIQVTDHIIISKDDYFSFKENNLL